MITKLFVWILFIGCLVLLATMFSKKKVYI